MNIRLILIIIILFIAKSTVNGQIEEFGQEMKKFKEYEISKHLIDEAWTKIKIGFNNSYDTLDLEEKPLSIEEFKFEFAKLLLNKKDSDTVVVYFDYKENIDLEKIIKSRQIVANELVNFKNRKIYFANYIKPSQFTNAKQDSLYLKVNRQVSINNEKIEYSTLKAVLKQKQTKSILLFAEKDVSMQDLVEILEIGDELNIRILMNTK